jgi:hypothetical protein
MIAVIGASTSFRLPLSIIISSLSLPPLSSSSSSSSLFLLLSLLLPSWKNQKEFRIRTTTSLHL